MYREQIDLAKAALWTRAYSTRAERLKNQGRLLINLSSGPEEDPREKKNEQVQSSSQFHHPEILSQSRSTEKSLRSLLYYSVVLLRTISRELAFRVISRSGNVHTEHVQINPPYRL